MKKTSPETVREAHLAAFSGKMNMVDCASHCGMTLREFKLTFWEYLKYNSPIYPPSPQNNQLELF